MCFGGGGGGTNTVVNSPNIPAPVLGGLDTLINRASSVTSQPYAPPPSPEQQVAPLTADQTSSFDAIRGLQGGYQPYTAGATDLTQRGSAPIAPTLHGFDADALAKYSNPYLQGVIGNVNEQFDRQGAIGAQGIAAQSASAGAFGGDRATIATQEANRNNNQLRANTIAGLENQNFSQAQNQFNVEENRGLAARESDASNAFAGSGQLQGIAGTNLALGLQGAGALGTAGGVQQQQQQNINNAALGNYYDARNFPYQQLSAFQSAVQGTPYSAFGSTTTSPGPSPLSQAAGLGIAGLGGYGIYRNLTSGLPSTGAANPGIAAVGGLGGNGGFPAGGGAASSGADFQYGAGDSIPNFGASGLAGGVARGGMVRPRVSYARGGIAGYEDGGDVDGGYSDVWTPYRNPEAQLAAEMGIAGNFADRARAAMANGSPRSYGGPWTDGINIPVGDQTYPAPAGSTDDTAGAHGAAFPDYQGPSQPLNISYPPPAGSADDTAGAHGAAFPDVQGPPAPAIARTPPLTPEERVRRALGVLPEPPKGAAMGAVDQNPRPDNSLTADTARLWLLEHGQHPDRPPEQVAIEAAALREKIAREQATADQWRPGPPAAPPPAEPAFPVSNAPQDYGNDPPLAGEGIGVGTGSASSATTNAVADPGITGFPPGGGPASTAAPGIAGGDVSNFTPGGAGLPGRTTLGADRTADGRANVPVQTGPRRVDAAPGPGQGKSLTNNAAPKAAPGIAGEPASSPSPADATRSGIRVAPTQEAVQAVGQRPGMPDWALPLLQAGFATMSGVSKFPLVNIGHGGQEGVNAYQRQRQVDATNQLKSFELQRQLSHDANTHAVQLAGLQERHDAAVQRSQDRNLSIEERRQAHQQADLTRQSMIEMQRGWHQMHEDNIVDRNQGRKTSEERESDAQDKRDAVADRGEAAFRKSLIDPVTGDFRDPVKGPQQLEDYTIRSHPNSTQGKAAVEARTQRQVSAIPPAAIDYLKKNPGTRSQFEQKFGKGLAARVLGE